MDKIESEIDNIIECTTQNIEDQETNNTEDCEIVKDIMERHNTMSTMDTSNTSTNAESSSLPLEDNKLIIDSQNIEVFNIALHQYLKIEEEIKTLLEAIKARNKTKRDLAETISTYLRANEIRNVNLGGTYKGKKLESKVTYSSKGFSKESVTNAIYNELKAETEVFDKIMESISRTNVITEKWNLRIINEKSLSSKTDKAKNKIDMAEELLNEDD